MSRGIFLVHCRSSVEGSPELLPVDLSDREPAQSILRTFGFTVVCSCETQLWHDSAANELCPLSILTGRVGRYFGNSGSPWNPSLVAHDS